MSLNFDLIGADSEPAERTWTSSDVLLYALGVGAGAADPLAELEFTTENSIGITTKVLPTFGNMIAGGGGGRSLGDFDPAAFVHAEQAFTLHPLATTRGSIFIRGEGGFGGERGPDPDWEMPSGKPDEQLTYQTRTDQALLYRLTGDRNPLHSDPKFAARGGFDRPILHGMCTYGYTGRGLLHAVCGSDPARFTSMEARFTKPVVPGDELVISIWNGGGSTAFFRTTVGGAPVIDRGRLTFTS